MRHLASQVYAKSDVEALAAYSCRRVTGFFSPAESGWLVLILCLACTEYALASGASVMVSWPPPPWLNGWHSSDAFCHLGNKGPCGMLSVHVLHSWASLFSNTRPVDTGSFYFEFPVYNHGIILTKIHEKLVHSFFPDKIVFFVQPCKRE